MSEEMEPSSLDRYGGGLRKRRLPRNVIRWCREMRNEWKLVLPYIALKELMFATAWVLDGSTS